MRPWWSDGAGWLVGIRMDILWNWSVVCRGSSSRWSVSEKVQASLDMNVIWIQLCSALVGIQCIIDLIVAGLVLRNWLAQV